MKTRSVLLFTCLSMLVAAVPAVGKDLTIRQKTTVAGVGPRSSESMQYWTSKRMIVDEEKGRMIVDFEDETITSIDKTKMTWIVVTFDQMSKQMDEQRADMAKRTENLEPQAKAQLERMGEPVGNKAAPVLVEPTGKREKIAGYDSEEYKFTGTAVSGTLWVSKELPLPLGPEQMKAFLKSTDGMKGFGRQFAMAMAQLKSVPLRAVMRMDLGPEGTTSTNEVLEVRQESAPPGMADVPQGFTELKPQPAPAPAQ